MKKRLVSMFLVLSMVGAVLSGCGGSGGESTDSEDKDTENVSSEGSEEESTDKKDTIKIGIRSDGIDQLEVVRAKIEAAGYTVEESVFDDSVQPNVALGEGSIDVNWYQHGPYLETYNAENDTDFVMIEPKTAYPLFAMFSDKYDSIDKLPDGATIGLCNDATNQARALNMLQSEELITLDDSVEVPTMYDVKENPHNFEFIEAEMSVLPQSLSDADAICLAAAHMVNAGLSADGYLCSAPDGEDYAVGFVVRGEDKDAAWAKELAEIVQCDELAAYFADEKDGTMVPSWK
ncbi:MAG: metal ABC transporter substrate-binding protein [Dorea sp.]|jgi:D-methionine transport system substrate-binding protein|nr:metal ABC transporter substrate-binding protein [Dorea sp.]